MSHFVSEHICVWGKCNFPEDLLCASYIVLKSSQTDAAQWFIFYFFAEYLSYQLRSLQINHNGPMEGDIYCIYSWNYRLAIELDPAAEC